VLASRVTFAGGIAEHAFCRAYGELSALAVAEPASLYIAHNPEALAPAFKAAASHGAALAFDSEDLHSGEAPDDAPREFTADLLEYLERRYLPACRYVTAPSEAIAETLCTRYSIPRPTAIHNVFPWSDRRGIDGHVKDRRGPELSLYWYSQVIGLDRGLQDCIIAAGQLTQPVQIHLRGELSTQVETELRRLATESCVENRLFFHPAVQPDELLSRAAEHDVGLALEQSVSENRRRTVTNKLFLYFLAGLAVAATSTVGQSGVMATCPGVGFVYQPGDHHALRRGLQQLLDQPMLLEERKLAALRAAEERWNWEIESRTLIDLVQRTLAGEASRCLSGGNPSRGAAR
jgi:glycosyltransferase involved in cell wall biosynthesis